jgi:hypothetical protein
VYSNVGLVFGGGSACLFGCVRGRGVLAGYRLVRVWSQSPSERLLTVCGAALQATYAYGINLERATLDETLVDEYVPDGFERLASIFTTCVRACVRVCVCVCVCVPV